MPIRSKVSDIKSLNPNGSATIFLKDITISELNSKTNAPALEWIKANVTGGKRKAVYADGYENISVVFLPKYLRDRYEIKPDVTATVLAATTAIAFSVDPIEYDSNDRMDQPTISIPILTTIPYLSTKADILFINNFLTVNPVRKVGYVTIVTPIPIIDHI